MKLKVEIDGEVKEVDDSKVELPENYDLVNPDNASSKGYFTQAQLDKKIENRLSREDTKIKKQLKKDPEFLQDAAKQQWGISFDEEGQPKGLKPEVDVDEVRREAVENVKGKYESEIEDLSSQKNTYKSKLIEKSILSATKGDWKEEYTKHQDEGRVKPIAVNQFRDLFDLTDDGQVALKDSSGEGFHPSPNGGYVTPDEYLTDRDKFGDYMHDNRQKGSGFQGGAGGGNGKPVFTEAEIEAMTDDEYEENRPEIKKAAAEGRIQ